MARFDATDIAALDRIWQGGSVPAHAHQRVHASGGLNFAGMDDPRLLEFIRTGGSGSDNALRNMAVLRCVSLISESIGMLPVNLIENTKRKEQAKKHAAYRLLKLKPNTWQTPYEFKSTMQLSVLRHGDAYARVVWSGNRPVALVPLNSPSVQPKLGDDWRMVYDYTRKDGGVVRLQANEVFHLRDLSADGISGMSRVNLARDAIDLAIQAQTAALRTFKTGVMAGGAIEVPTGLSDTAYGRMKGSLEDDYSGALNALKWMLLEEGAKANKFGTTGADAQHIENRNMQVQEIARAFGVPRPLLMMDDTSWGSGIEQLGIYFVQYGLLHWFTAWEQALARVLLSDEELETHQFKFNERALLRGTLKDQSDFFAKALGAGGQAPWVTQNEVRELSDLPESDDPNANLLRNPMTQKDPANEPAKSS